MGRAKWIGERRCSWRAPMPRVTGCNEMPSWGVVGVTKVASSLKDWRNSFPVLIVRMRRTVLILMMLIKPCSLSFSVWFHEGNETYCKSWSLWLVGVHFCQQSQSLTRRLIGPLLLAVAPNLKILIVLAMTMKGSRLNLLERAMTNLLKMDMAVVPNSHSKSLKAHLVL